MKNSILSILTIIKYYYVLYPYFIWFDEYFNHVLSCLGHDAAKQTKSDIWDHNQVSKTEFRTINLICVWFVLWFLYFKIKQDIKIYVFFYFYFYI